jgi:hypothetical protein
LEAAQDEKVNAKNANTAIQSNNFFIKVFKRVNKLKREISGDGSVELAHRRRERK